MDNSTNKPKIDDELLKKVEAKAKENLRGIIRENQMGYSGYLREEMKNIFKEMGIEWKSKSEGVLED